MAERPTLDQLIGVLGEPFTEDDFKAGLAQLTNWLARWEIEGIKGRPIGRPSERLSASITTPPPNSPGTTPATLSNPDSTPLDLSGTTVIQGSTIT